MDGCRCRSGIGCRSYGPTAVEVSAGPNQISTHGGARAAPRGASEAACRTAGRLRKAHGLDHPVAQFPVQPFEYAASAGGSVRQLINPNFTVGFWDGTVDVCLPYIKGYVPPYYYTVLNYVLPSVEGYRAEQTNEGWIVTFSTTLFSANDYTLPSTSTRRREAPTSPFRRSGTIPYSTPALLRRCIDPSAF